MPTTARRRKKAKGGSESGAESAGGTRSSSRKSGPNSTSKKKEFPYVSFATLLFCLLTFPQIGKFIQFGPTAILGHSYFDLSKNVSEWRDLLHNKTVLIIGGPHRSGTGILWKAVTAHPEISGFGTPFQSGVSFSEGILMQDVYPKFGVATELLIKNQEGFKERMEGVGKFALADEESVHLAEKDERITADNLSRLLNRFGPYWNLTKPVWVDKSPPAAVMSRFLQELYNVNVDGVDSKGESGEAGGGLTSQTKFLFITRHPIANAYGHHHLLGGPDVVPFDTILRNYMKVHSYLKQDMPHLRGDPKLIRLEDFVVDPSGELKRIFDWLGVDSSQDTVEAVLKAIDKKEGIRKDVNGRYRERWCTEVNAFKRDRVAARFQPTVDELELGYDIKSWCKSR